MQAYQVVFNKPIAIKGPNEKFKVSANQNDKPQKSVSKGLFFEISGLYRTAKLRRAAIICHFGFFAASFSYYVTGRKRFIFKTNYENISFIEQLLML